MEFGFNALEIILPVGISFYTFQNIGYLIDVYKNNFISCKSFIDYNLFISFFPKLTAGPIERSDHFFKQITASRVLSDDNFFSGLILLFWGFFKKLVIADNIAVISRKVFLLKDPDFFILCAGVFAFTIQIYADFSGYTDIARGIGKLFGFNLLINFDNPYFSKSPSDFWRRWHISLSNWIRDYIYIPLGGARVNTSRWIINLFITFFMVGLWHGASWNFVIWGLYYWLLYLIFRFFKTLFSFEKLKTRYNFLVSIPLMFILTNIGWMIFYETDVHQLLRYFKLSPLDSSYLNVSIAIYLMIYILIYSAPLVFVSSLEYIFEINKLRKSAFDSYLYKIALSLILFIGILLFRSAGQSDFIYFQF